MTCVFSLSAEALSVTVSVPSRTGRVPRRNTFAWTVLTALAGEVDATVDAGRHRVGHPAQAPRRPGVSARSLATAGDEGARSDREIARELFDQLGTLEAGAPGRQRVRDQLVEMHLPLVEYLARRFADRGEPLDDLVQVGTIGLIKAVDRFDTERGVEFSTYATPTIVGEIKRHFRDKGWAVRVPRRLQELRAALSSATSDLSQTHGPLPHRRRARRAPQDRRGGGARGPGVGQRLHGRLPRGLRRRGRAVRWPTRSAARTSRWRAWSTASRSSRCSSRCRPREKKILMLRFFGNMTQSQIAAELGISQMHVSRLLARTLAQLRERPARRRVAGPGPGGPAGRVSRAGARPGPPRCRRAAPAPRPRAAGPAGPARAGRTCRPGSSRPAARSAAAPPPATGRRRRSRQPAGQPEQQPPAAAAKARGDEGQADAGRRRTTTVEIASTDGEDQQRHALHGDQRERRAGPAAAPALRRRSGTPAAYPATPPPPPLG